MHPLYVERRKLIRCRGRTNRDKNFTIYDFCRLELVFVSHGPLLPLTPSTPNTTYSIVFFLSLEEALSLLQPNINKGFVAIATGKQITATLVSFQGLHK
jgi:hypothetical protein